MNLLKDPTPSDLSPERAVSDPHSHEVRFDKVIAKRGVLDPTENLIRKPFKSHELLERARASLEVETTP